MYDNVLTEKLGDYTAKPQITGTVRNPDISIRIAKSRTEYRPETIENILNMADQIKIEAIAEGKCVVDNVGQYLLNLSGPIEGEKPAFNSNLHKVGITYTPGKKLLEAIKNILFKFNLATTGPVVNSIQDATSKSINEQITSGEPAIIYGANLLIKGDNPLNGVFFTEDKEGATPKPAKLIISNTISQITISVPVLTAGQYKQSVTTQFAANYKLTKEPRTYVFPILLTVGGSDSESPDEI